MKIVKIAYYLTLILLLGAPGGIFVNAQEASNVITETVQADVEFNPLEIADTSSPRDTLRSYLTNMKLQLTFG